MTKMELAQAGIELAQKFLDANPQIKPLSGGIIINNGSPITDGRAVLQDDKIIVNMRNCSNAADMTFPGFYSDTTPYGIVQHYLGRHVLKNDRSLLEIKNTTGEVRITTYSDDEEDWFFEMFRLYVTNPHLLKVLRPGTYEELRKRFKLVTKVVYMDILNSFGVGSGTLELLRKKIKFVGDKGPKYESEKIRQSNISQSNRSDYYAAKSNGNRQRKTGQVQQAAGGYGRGGQSQGSRVQQGYSRP